MTVYFEIGGIAYISAEPIFDIDEEVQITEISEAIEIVKEKIAEMFCVSIDEVHEISEEVYLENTNDEPFYDA